MTMRPESANRIEKSASRFVDPARTDWPGPAQCNDRFLRFRCWGPMTHVEQKPERLHALDAVRGYALLLGIVLHATMSFLPSPTRIWIIQDSHPSITLGVLFFAIHVFRMTTFFLITGFFAHLSFHRRGTWASSGIACSASRCRLWAACRSWSAPVTWAASGQ